MGIFIKAEIGDACVVEGCERCVPVCPVNVFAVAAGRIVTDAEAEDECTLCELCLQACPHGAITIRRLYRER